MSFQPAPLALFSVSAITLCALIACSSSSVSQSECSGTTTSLTVSVVNDTNEVINICDATVTVNGPGTSNETLKPTGSTGDCSYVGNVGGAGTYTITATAAGYMTATAMQNVQTGCSATTNIEVMPSM